MAEVLGDSFDYLVSKKFGHVVIREKYVKKYSFFVRLENFFRKYTGTTIFLTRFVGVLSPLTNFLSGFEKIKIKKFIFYDFLGNFTDTIVLLTLGYIIGDNWESISGKLSVVSGIVAAAIILFFVYKIFGRKSNKPTSQV